VVVLVLVVLVRGTPAPGGAPLLAGLLAGLVGFVGGAAFYRALAVGTMSVVAPIGATGAVIPVIVGAVGGERPAIVQWVGMVVALAGCVLASREGAGAPTVAARWRLSIGLAVLSAIAIGAQLVLLGRASTHDAAWAVLLARIVSIGCFGAVALVMRPRLAIAAVPPLLVIGLLDTGANVAFAAATTAGLLAVVSVIGSTFPVITVALAHRRLGERLGGPQRVGVLLALVGVVAISAHA
jgi:drug/metabolite transporter (DMT)-like permease